MGDQIKGLMREIDQTIEEVFDVATRADAKDTAGSRYEGYEKGVTEVHDIAGKPQARELAEWIQEEMRSEERFPSAREVRQRGAKICRESGHEVSTGSWLGA